ncbi:MAG: SpoIVB peptidase [Thermacetogeniaceae bacterium]
MSKRRLHSLLSAFFLAACIYTIFFQSFSLIPSHYRVNVGDQVFFGNIFPPRLAERIVAFVSNESKERLNWQAGQAVAQGFLPFLGRAPIAARPGNVDLDLRLFGILPLKRVTLQVVPPVQVMMGGQSIGVFLHTEGVFVAGFSDITSTDGKTSCPARQAGIVAGDVILSIQGVKIQGDAEVSLLIDQFARRQDTISLQVKHRETVKGYQIKPVFCRETKRYRIGLFVRDGAAGVGTLTFFDPVTKKYGALGHVITNSETSELLDLKDGKIVGAAVEGIQKGQRGKIGEKIGLFLNDQKTSGNIDKNTTYGIYGVLQNNLINQLYPKPVPVAVGGQIKEGPAQMLTVLNGENVEAFNVEIQTVFPQPRPDGKSFIVRVVDPRILNRAGGIIQGMSGSPIIQNGKLIGAVTHVFINDPTLGYGIAAELMLDEAGLFPGKQLQNQTSWIDQDILDQAA